MNEIDQYIETFPIETQKQLNLLRKTIQSAAPLAEEVISYKMPAYKLNGMLVYFAGYQNHIGFYPTGKGIENFKGEFGNYKWSKGAVQFPIDKPLPLDLIVRMVKSRVAENELKKELKKETKR